MDLRDLTLDTLIWEWEAIHRRMIHIKYVKRCNAAGWWPNSPRYLKMCQEVLKLRILRYEIIKETFRCQQR